VSTEQAPRSSDGVKKGSCRACDKPSEALSVYGLCRTCDRRFSSMRPAIRNRAPTAERERPQKLAGRYEFEQRCGQGAMGEVWAVHDTKLDRRVALKVILERHSSDAEFIRRLIAEAAAAARGGIVVYDIGVDPRLGHYYTMEFIEGKDLGRILEESALPPIHAARYLFAVAAQLASIHASGTVHRDVKPANILVDLRDQARLVDFGLASAAARDADARATGPRAGTPCYMAPEQVAGGPVNARTDIYNFGATLFHALTGRPLFQVDNESELFSLIQTVNPPLPREINPRIPRDLEIITCRCLAKDPAKRYRTADAVAEDLRLFLRGYPINARPRSLSKEMWLWAMRERALAAALTFLVVATGFLIWTTVETCRGLGRANALTASVTAAALEPRLQKWGRQLEVGVADPALRSTLTKGDFNPLSAQTWLDGWCERSDLPTGTAMLLDAQGRGIAHCPRLAQMIGAELNKRDYFRGARAGRGVYVSSTYPSVIDGRTRFALATSLHDEFDRFVGVLVTGCDAGAAMGIPNLELGERQITVLNPAEPESVSNASSAGRKLIPLWRAGSIRDRGWLTFTARAPIHGTKAMVVVQSNEWVLRCTCVTMVLATLAALGIGGARLWRERRPTSAGALTDV
jgi:hypothetical protein